ncbi:MAG TPA: hypothetical protein VFI39_05960 [Gemmatimonadales bacterium]|nr:hypothetical protein [Gemmatimonadales bacterium]
MTHPAAWFESRTADAPAPLRARMRELVAHEWSADGLAAAAERGLAEVVAHPGDRRVALDLLAADGLVTLALLYQAEHRPEQLDAFATRLGGGVGR